MTSCRELLLIKSNKVQNLIIVWTKFARRARHQIGCNALQEQFGINLTFNQHSVLLFNEQSSRSFKIKQRSSGTTARLCFAF